MQLDASEYKEDTATTPRLKTISSYLDKVYFRVGNTDYDHIYPGVCYATRCGFDAALRGVDSWIEQTTPWSNVERETFHCSRIDFLAQEESYRNDSLWILDDESESDSSDEEQEEAQE